MVLTTLKYNGSFHLAVNQESLLWLLPYCFLSVFPSSVCFLAALQFWQLSINPPAFRLKSLVVSPIFASLVFKPLWYSLAPELAWFHVCFVISIACFCSADLPFRRLLLPPSLLRLRLLSFPTWSGLWITNCWNSVKLSAVLSQHQKWQV